MPIYCSIKRDEAAFSASEKLKKSFWLHVIKHDKCWLFEPVSPQGYGVFSFDGQSCFAHRFSLIQNLGFPSNREMYVRHKCQNKNCVNPQHLEWGTQEENRRDQWRDETHTRAKSRGEKNRNSKLSEEQVLDILKEWHSTDISMNLIAKKYGVSKATISAIGNNKTWKYLSREHFKENVERSTVRRGERIVNSTLSGLQVLKIIELLVTGELSHRQISAKYGVDQSTISVIKTRGIWAHLTDAEQVLIIRKKKLCLAQVKDIRRLGQKGQSYRDIAKNFPCSESIISAICQNKVWYDPEFKALPPRKILDPLLRPEKVLKGRSKGTKHFRAKINEQIAKSIIRIYSRNEKSVQEIADKFMISNTSVTCVLTGKTWKDATEGIRVPLRAIEHRAIQHGAAHHMAKIDSRSVKSIRRRWEAGELSVDLAKEYGVASRTIRDVGNRITWKHVKD